MVKLVSELSLAEKRAAFDALPEDERARFMLAVVLEQLETVNDNIIELRAWCDTLDRMSEHEEGAINPLSINLIVSRMMSNFEFIETPLESLIEGHRRELAESAAHAKPRIVK